MDKEFEKRLREVMQSSRELIMRSEELTAQTERLMQEFRKKKKKEAERSSGKLGSS